MSSPVEHLIAARAAFAAGESERAMEQLSLATGGYGWKHTARTRRDLYLYFDADHLYGQAILRLVAYEQCKHEQRPRSDARKLFDSWWEQGLVAHQGGNAAGEVRRPNEHTLRIAFARWAAGESPRPALLLPEVSVSGKRLDQLCIEEPVDRKQLTLKDRIYELSAWADAGSAFAFPQAVRRTQVNSRYLARLEERLGGQRCWVVELKATLNMEAIGQVLSYRALLQAQHAKWVVSRMIIGCSRSDPVVEPICRQFGIEVVVLG